MFTGIIETTGIVRDVKKDQDNLRLSVECGFVNELKIDQSVAHNGVCLTVIAKQNNSYDVIAIEETLKRSNLGLCKPGDEINLERCLKVNDRLDGHIVQGHVDAMASVTHIRDMNGSWLVHFFCDDKNNLTVEKGSVCLNGVSLTIVSADQNNFSVAIIPYTLEHTNFKNLKVGDKVNVEFDIIGKYVARLTGNR